MKAKYHPGYRVGSMTLIEVARKVHHGANVWRVLCDCGQESEKLVHVLSSQKYCSRTCPEYRNWTKYPENAKKELRAWWGMQVRCALTGHSRYSERGISMCEEWQKDFMAFYSHIGPAPSPEMTVDRIDNNKGYEPGNVRWATRVEQANNKENTIMITANGVTQSLADWARELRVPYMRLFQRYEDGWNHNDIINGK